MVKTRRLYTCISTALKAGGVANFPIPAPKRANQKKKER